MLRTKKSATTCNVYVILCVTQHIDIVSVCIDCIHIILSVAYTKLHTSYHVQILSRVTYRAHSRYIKMHTLFKLNKQSKKQKPESDEDFWSDDSNSSNEFWDTDDQSINEKLVKSILTNDSNALNLNFVNRRRRVRVYEGDLQPVLATYLEEQDKLIPAGERYRNNIIESNIDSPRGNISPIRRAIRIHSSSRKKKRLDLRDKGSSKLQGNGDGRQSPLHRHFGSVGLIANWHQKTMKKIEGVKAFGKSYLTSSKRGEDEEKEGKSNALENTVVNDLLHVSRKKKNLRRRTEYLLSRHPEKQFIKEKSDLQIKSAKILASGSRRDKKAILKLRRFRIQQSVKG